MIDSNNKRNSYRENTRGANQYYRQQIESVAKKNTNKYSELEDLAKQFKELQP